MNLSTQLKVKGILLTKAQSTSIVFIYSRQCTCTAGGRSCLKYIVRLVCVSGKEVACPWQSGAKGWEILYIQIKKNVMGWRGPIS